MKFKLISIVFALGLTPINAFSGEVVLTEGLIRSILIERDNAALQNDYQSFTKYYYPGSIIVYDHDSDPHTEKKELGYEEFMPKWKQDLVTFQNAEASEYKILSIYVHEGGLSGESITRNKVVLMINEARIELEAEIQIRYEVLDEEVKIAREEVELLK